MRNAKFMTADELFSLIDDILDGCGLSVTDQNWLAESIAEWFDCLPIDVYPEYEGTDDEPPTEPEDDDFVTDNTTDGNATAFASGAASNGDTPNTHGRIRP